MYELSDLGTLSPLFVVLFIHNHEAGKYCSNNVTLCTHILHSVNNNFSSVVPNTQAVTMVITIFRRDDLRSHSLSGSRFNKNIYYQPSFVDIPIISISRLLLQHIITTSYITKVQQPAVFNAEKKNRRTLPPTTCKWSTCKRDADRRRMTKIPKLAGPRVSTTLNKQPRDLVRSAAFFNLTQI